ncbi:MAG TPA: putative ABC exporter domain-containing protein [Gemmatimonadales bacterium]|nr:putative ABC exporter domain-containing protein [Gemmatimonadales bacterium]
MTGALVYLTARSAANRVATQVARLRSPRYLLALVFGVGWLVFIVSQQRRTPSVLVAGDWVVPGGTLVALGLVIWAWISGGDGRALLFSAAEVTFLFPAPLTRRVLVHYKLLSNQPLVLLNVVIWTLLARRGSIGVSPVFRAVAIWTLITTLSLHRLGAALVRTSLVEHGRFGLRHRVVSVVALVAAAAALVWGARDVLPPMLAALRGDEPTLHDAVIRALDHPILSVVLWPFRAMVQPLGVNGAAEWRAAMLPAVGLLLLHYVWVIRSDAAFEEAAAEASLARARRTATGGTAARRVALGGRPPSAPVFPLRPTGWPATALLWKNLAAVLRWRRARAAAVGLFAAGAIVWSASSTDPSGTLAQMAGALALTWLAFAVVLGPQWIRNDLRGDLAHAELLRSYPLRGWAIVASETAASALTLTLLELALATIACLALFYDPTVQVGFGPRGRRRLLGEAVFLLPAINFMAMLIHNGAAVLFPGWIRIGIAAKGVEALGQRLLATSVFLVLLGVLLLVPGEAYLVVFEACRRTLGPASFWPAFFAGLVILSLEAIVLARWLGGAFERMDPSDLRT